MLRKLVLIAGICAIIAGCTIWPIWRKSQAYFWVEAFQDGKQIGIWRTAPGSSVVEDFGMYKFTAEDGTRVELQGPVVLVIHQVEPEKPAAPEKAEPQQKPAQTPPKAAPPKAEEPKPAPPKK